MPTRSDFWMYSEEPAIHLSVGQSLVAGAWMRKVEYKVRLGDTLSDIARRHGTTVEALVRANELVSADILWVGQVLKIQASADPQSNPNSKAACASTQHSRRNPSAQGSSDSEKVPLYRQDDERWGALTLGNKLNIAGYGCALTATAMAISKISGKPMTPGELDTYLDENRGYSKESLLWDTAARARGLGATWPFPRWSLQTIDWELRAGRPVVVGVDDGEGSAGGRWGTDHWVTITGKETEQGRMAYTAHDPANGKRFLFNKVGEHLRASPASGARQNYRTTGELRTFFSRGTNGQTNISAGPEGKDRGFVALGGPRGAPRQHAKEVEEQDNPYGKLTVAQRAEKVKSLLETGWKQVLIGTGPDILEVFQASESMDDFFALQDLVDMEVVIDECADVTAVRLGALGPIQTGRDLLNEKRADYITGTTEKYGPDFAQIFILHMFNNMYGDDIKATMALLTQGKHLSQTLQKMPLIQESLQARGMNVTTLKDREFKGTDVLRGIGSGIEAFFSSGEAAKDATSFNYFFEKETLPKEYQDALDKIEKAKIEEAFTLKNLALGTFDYVTLGIPMGLYHLVTGTVHGLKELVVGDAEQGIKELVPALLLLVSSLGVKAYQVVQKKGIGAKGSVLTGPEGSSQFVLKGYSGPLSREATRLGAMLQLNPEAQGAAGLLLERYGQQGVGTLTNYMRADSKTVRFIHQNGLRGLDALLKAEGDLSKARGLMSSQPAAYLSAPTLAKTTSPKPPNPAKTTPLPKSPATLTVKPKLGKTVRSGNEIEVFLTEEAGGIIGEFNPKTGDLYIHMIEVRAPFNGKGLSTKLYAKLIEEAGKVKTITGKMAFDNAKVIKKTMDATQTPRAKALSKLGYTVHVYDPATGVLVSSKPSE